MDEVKIDSKLSSIRKTYSGSDTEIDEILFESTDKFSIRSIENIPGSIKWVKLNQSKLNCE